MRVEHDRRDGQGWAMEPLIRVSDRLGFTGLPFAITLAEIYAQTGTPRW